MPSTHNCYLQMKLHKPLRCCCLNWIPTPAERSERRKSTRRKRIEARAARRQRRRARKHTKPSLTSTSSCHDILQTACYSKLILYHGDCKTVLQDVTAATAARYENHELLASLSLAGAAAWAALCSPICLSLRTLYSFACSCCCTGTLNCSTPAVVPLGALALPFKMEMTPRPAAILPLYVALCETVRWS